MGHILLLASMLTVALLGSGVIQAVEAARPADEVVVVQGAEPTGLDNTLERGILVLSPARHVLDPLVHWADDMSLVPWLAKSWRAIDGTTWEFKLRDDVKFHDGTPLTSEDVAFTFNRMLDPKTKSRIRPMFSAIREVRATDPTTARFFLKQPFSSLVSHLPILPILSKAAFQKMGEAKYIAAPVGSGPYRFVQWQKGVRIVFEANPTYWRGAPKIKRVVFRAMPEDATRVAALQSGEADLIMNVPPTFVGALKSMPGVQVRTARSLRTQFLVINHKRKPLDNLRVRQALNYAVGADAIIQAVLGGNAYRSGGPIGPAVWGHNPKLKPFPYDPDRAKALLREAGVAPGTPLTLVATSGRYLMDREVAQAIGGNLEKVGFKVNLQILEYEAVLSLMRGPEEKRATLDLVMFGNANMTADAYYNFSGNFLSLGGAPYGGHPEVDRLIDLGTREADRAKQGTLYQEAVRVLMEDWLPIIPLYDVTSIYGVRSNLDWSPRPDEFIFLHGATLR